MKNDKFEKRIRVWMGLLLLVVVMISTPAMGYDLPFRIHCLERTPVIDGAIQPGEWPDAEAVHLSRAFHNEHDIKLYFAHDNTYLYLAAKVADGQLWADGGGSGAGEYWEHYNDDAIEWYFDPNNSRDSVLMSDDRFLALNIGNATDPQNGSGIVSRRSFNKGNGAGSAEGTGYPGVLPPGLVYKVQYDGTVNNASDTDRGYTIEVAIPWTDLMRSPSQEGDWMGINVIVISDDTGGVRDWSDNRSIEPASARFTTPIRPDEYVEMKCSATHTSQSGLHGPAAYPILQFHRNGDGTAPAAVTSLQAYNARPYSVRLKWVSPAENSGQGGAVKRVDVRYAASPITEANFASATSWPVRMPVPDPGNGAETRVMGLTPGTAYYFALQPEDEQGNKGAIVTTGPYSTLSVAALGVAIPESAYGGYIHVSPSGRYFMKENGANFIPAGYHFLLQNDKIRYLYDANVWTGSSLYNFSTEANAHQTVTAYLDSLRAAGITLMRLFMEDFSLNAKGGGNFDSGNGAYWLEYPRGTYNSDMANFVIDLLQLCSERGIYVSISPFDTFYYDDYFTRTAWYSGNGGPLNDMNDFFTSSAALEMCKARWTWVINTIGRSGYADMVFGWEVLNEWDSWEWTRADSDPNTDAAIRSEFIAELAEHIKSLDQEHMVLSSTTTLDPRGALAAFNYYTHLFDASLPHLYFPGNREPWNNPATYPDTAVFEEQSRSIAWWTLNQLNPKPVLNGEWGPSDGWMPDPLHPSYSAAFQESDDELITRRLWFTELAAGAAGPGIRMPGGVRAYGNGLRLSDNMLGTVKTISAFVENGSTHPLFDFTGFNSHNMDADLSVSGTTAKIQVTGCSDGSKGLVYLAVDRNKTDMTNISGATLTIGGLTETATPLTVEFWNPDPDQTGPVSQTVVTPSGGSASVAIPEFELDTAIRFFPSTGQSNSRPEVTTTGLTFSPADSVAPGDTVTISASAVNRSGGPIYYRFDLVPNYGTSAYDPFNNWTMIQDFSTSNTCNYRFSSANNYIVVVYASSTMSIPTSGAASIIGGAVSVGGTVMPMVKGLSVTPARSLKVGDTVTFSVDGASETGAPLYYRFNLVPHYATDRYDPFNNWILLRDFSTSRSFSYTFNNIGDYIVVAYVSETPGIPSGAAPIVGGAIHIGAE